MMSFRNNGTAILVFIFTVYGCTNQNINNGNSVSRTSSYPKTIQKAKKDQRYLMLHSGINLYSIILIELDKSKKQVTVQLDKVDSFRLIRVRVPDSTNSQVNQVKAAVTPETHIYMRDSISYTLDEPHTILLNNIARIESVD